MLKKILIAASVPLVIALIAVVVQLLSHRAWERRVWSCYRDLGSGTVPLRARFTVPQRCRTGDMVVADLGTPEARVLFGFRPPRTMWVSYALRTVDYDAYVIEVRQLEGRMRAQIHHGSD
jgi:hypothetical protein